MSIQIFLGLLLAFGGIASSITECIKKVILEKENMPYNILAIVIALIVGGCGTAIYYH